VRGRSRHLKRAPRRRRLRTLTYSFPRETANKTGDPRDSSNP
jgi:hypothetical protein